jgi:hypothetical protein
MLRPPLYWHHKIVVIVPEEQDKYVVSSWSVGKGRGLGGRGLPSFHKDDSYWLFQFVQK